MRTNRTQENDLLYPQCAWTLSRHYSPLHLSLRNNDIFRLSGIITCSLTGDCLDSFHFLEGKNMFCCLWPPLSSALGPDINCGVAGGKRKWRGWRGASMSMALHAVTIPFTDSVEFTNQKLRNDPTGTQRVGVSKPRHIKEPSSPPSDHPLPKNMHSLNHRHSLIRFKNVILWNHICCR